MTHTERPQVVAHVAAAPEVEAEVRAALLGPARAAVALHGGVLLETCHRVEVIGSAPDEQAVDGMRHLVGIDAARHVIRLALGLESAVVGEDQVLHQLRGAVADARRGGIIAPDLSLLLDRALRAGRTGRSWRPAMATSLGDRAVDVVERTIGPVAGRRVLVVGAGAMGRLAADVAGRRGALVSVASRDQDRSRLAASGIAGAKTVPLDPGPTTLAAMDAVVVALGGPWLLGSLSADILAGRPIVVDLSMPPAVDRQVASLLERRYVDVDDLAGAVTAGPAAERYRARLEELASVTLERYLTSLAERRRSQADRLAARVERHRAEALAAYLRDRPDLDAAARIELERMSRSISARLFREPLARLASDPDGRRGRALEELFGA